MLTIIKKHRERAALIGLGVGLLLFVGGGIYLQKQNRKSREMEQTAEVKKVQLTVRKDTSSSTGKEGGNSITSATSAFFLRPAPGELLEQLADLAELREDVAQKRFLSMRVIWPVYFFETRVDAAGQEYALFDVSEDGFGVEIVGQVKLDAYPELNELNTGGKLWVGGEIIGVDLSGTGTIYLQIEQIDLSPDGPLALRKSIDGDGK